MSLSDSIVKPICNDLTPTLGPLSIIAAGKEDFSFLFAGIRPGKKRHLYLSRLAYDSDDLKTPAVVGPVMGAPYAAMLLEIVHAWGARTIIFWGWCGSIDARYRTGDIIVPQGSLIHEGTSLQYDRRQEDLVSTDDQLSDLLRGRLESEGAVVKPGVIWTTDAIFRETPEKLEHFKRKGACAVEMELSALCTVASAKGMALACVLVVSDELFTYQWRPGFKSGRFLQARKSIAAVLSKIRYPLK